MEGNTQTLSAVNLSTDRWQGCQSTRAGSLPSPPSHLVSSLTKSLKVRLIKRHNVTSRHRLILEACCQDVGCFYFLGLNQSQETEILLRSQVLLKLLWIISNLCWGQTQSHVAGFSRMSDFRSIRLVFSVQRFLSSYWLKSPEVLVSRTRLLMKQSQDQEVSYSVVLRSIPRLRLFDKLICNPHFTWHLHFLSVNFFFRIYLLSYLINF